jgi:hypothetical protein
MSDKIKIDAAIDKAATECVEELLAASKKDGGKPWLEIIHRKMRQAFTWAEPKTPLLRVGRLEFQKFRGGLRVAELTSCDTEYREAGLLDAASTAKLARWLNGGE